MTEVGNDFNGALASAYRQALRVGLPVVGTDLVLYQALLRTSVLRESVPDIRHPALQDVRSGSGGLEDPDPPAYRLSPDVDEDVALLAEAELHEAAYFGADLVRERAARGKPVPDLPSFSPAVHSAVYAGLHAGVRAEVRPVGAAHLAVGLLSLPGSAAAQLLGRVTGEDWGPGSLHLRRLAEAARAAPGEPAASALSGLVLYGLLPARGEPVVSSGWWRPLTWLITAMSIRRPYRRHGAGYGHPMLHVVRREATLIAVRAGHDVVTGVHLVLAILLIHEQLAADGRELAAEVARWNAAGEILAAHGVTHHAAARAGRELPPDPADDESRLDDLPSRGWRPPRAQPAEPAPGRTALTAMRGASLAAHRQGHPYAGTTHLLVELLADPSGPAARLLRRLDADPEAVHAAALRSLAA